MNNDDPQRCSTLYIDKTAHRGVALGSCPKAPAIAQPMRLRVNLKELKRLQYAPFASEITSRPQTEQCILARENIAISHHLSQQITVVKSQIYYWLVRKRTIHVK